MGLDSSSLSGWLSSIQSAVQRALDSIIGLSKLLLRGRALAEVSKYRDGRKRGDMLRLYGAGDAG
jgi:hypothetical protein